MLSYPDLEVESPWTTSTYDDPRCRCAGHGFCPIHGSYTPRVLDQEVASAFHESSHPRPVAHRVVRKQLPK